MIKIELHQGRARVCECDGFHNLGTFDEAAVTLQTYVGLAPKGPRAFTACALRVSFTTNENIMFVFIC